MQGAENRKFIIATHGTLASGIKSSLDIIVGRTENVSLIEAYTDGNRSPEQDIADIAAGIKDGDELIIFTDLLGGSITNQMAHLALKENVHIISGFNLPLIIEMITGDPAIALPEFITAAVQSAKEQIVYVNKLIDK